MRSEVAELLQAWLGERLSEGARAFLATAREEIAAGVEPRRLGMLLGLASRHARDRSALAPSPEELAAAASLVPGWLPERWGQLEALRVALLLTIPDDADLESTIEFLFSRADEGESRALFRALGLASDPGRFLWRLQDGCRTNIVPVFEAIACDTPFPARGFDDVAWRQLCIKAVFIGAPLWRVQGLDGRLDGELARMALDLVEERRSAGRAIPADLWLCVGEFDQDRSLPALRTELREGDAEARAAALLALGRAGAAQGLDVSGLGDADAEWARIAQEGRPAQTLWGTLPTRGPDPA